MMLPRAVSFFSVLVLGSLLQPSRAADTPAVPPDVAPALAPAEAKKSFQVARGLEFELVAIEPTVQQPLSITFDDRGRLWVLQYLQYPIPNGLKAVEVDQYLRTKYDRVPEPPPEGPKGRTGSSSSKTRTATASSRRPRTSSVGSISPQAWRLGYDGLFVVQPPYLLFYADKNHDDVPDGDPRGAAQGLRHGRRPRLRQLAQVRGGPTAGSTGRRGAQ